jgi:nicotinamide mononucleotide adenylyltransferase
MNNLVSVLRQITKELILEGGNAADALIDTKLKAQPENADSDMSYSKIEDHDLSMVLPVKYGVFPDSEDQTFVGKILYFLSGRDLLDSNVPPRFLLGSTRLAALKKYGSDVITTDDVETSDVITMASEKKVDYGDLDIDVSFLASPKEIVSAIEELDPATYAAKAGNGKVHIAIKVDDRVFQIDLVDISKNRDVKKFLNKSSFVDLASNIKGAFSIILLRSVAAAMELSEGDAFESIMNSAKENPDSPFSKLLKKQDKLGWRAVGARFSLGDQGLKLVLDLRKPMKDNPSKMSRKTIDIDSKARIGYENLDALAKTILNSDDADGSTIYHATKLAEFLGKYKNSHQLHNIWKMFTNSADMNLRGTIPEEEYQSGMKELARLMKQEWVPQAVEPITEGKTSIGRFLGSNKFSDKDALEVVKVLVDETDNQGKPFVTVDLTNNSAVQLVEKMDSMFCHFGLDERGKFFMESSNSGRVYKENVKQKFGFSEDLYESFMYLSKNNSFQDSLKDIKKKVGPFRYDAELFPVLTHEGNSQGDIVFVGTPYSKSKFGTKGAFVLFSCKLWNQSNQNWVSVNPQQNNQLTSLLKYESVQSGWADDWKIYTNDQDMAMKGKVRIKIGQILSGYLDTEENYQKALSILSNKKMTPEKKKIVEELNRVRNEIQDALNGLANNSKSKLGGTESYIEGLILKIKRPNGDVYEVKGTSDLFDERKEFYWKDRTNALNLEKSLERHFLKDVLGLHSSDPATLNRIINQAADAFVPESEGKRRKSEFLETLIPYLRNNDIDFNEIKRKSKESLKLFINEFKNIKSEFKSRIKELDKDTIKKTINIFNLIESKITKIKEFVNSNLKEKQFFIMMLDSLIGRRVDKLINFEAGNGINPKDEFRKKVIIWNGRAQPWHVGHDAMIQKGKKLLDKLGGDAVYIMLVKGENTSENSDENPLSGDEQYELVSSVYKDDPQVIVSTRYPKSGYILDLIQNVYKDGHKVIGWLAGGDRVGEYSKNLRSFSPNTFTQDHSYSPIDRDASGDVLVKMIETPRIMSGTKARELAKKVPFDQFIDKVAPQNISKQARKNYLDAYEKMKSPDEMNEISAMGAAGGGAVEGAAGIESKKEAMISEVMNYLIKSLSQE